MKADDTGHHPSTKNTKYKDKDTDKYKYKDKDKVERGPNMSYILKSLGHKPAKYDILIILVAD